MSSQVANENGDDSLTAQHWHRDVDYSGTQNTPNYDGREDSEILLGYSESMNHTYELGEYRQHSGPPVTTANTLQPPIAYPGYQAHCGMLWGATAFGGSEMSPGSNSIVLRPVYDSTGGLQDPRGGQPPPPDTVEFHAYGEYAQNPIFTLPFIDPIHSPGTHTQHDPGQSIPAAWLSAYRQFDMSACSMTAPLPLLPVEQPQHEFPVSSSTPSGSMSFTPLSQEDDEESEPEPLHIRNWKMIPSNALVVTGTRYFIPQYMYKPNTRTDRSRYVEEMTNQLQEPIIFCVDHPYEWGISLEDARSKARKNLTRLQGKHDLMFEGCGPSVSIRIKWKGYQPWNRPIKTQDDRTPKGPIIRAKLAKKIAGCVSRFINEKRGERMDDDGDKRFRVGPGRIVVEDLILVSLHHVSKGSWQPQLRLRQLPWRRA